MKMDLRMLRKNVQLLAKMIEKGPQTKEGEAVDGLMRAAGEGSLEALQKADAELLEKAGLSEMNTRLSSLNPK